MIFAHIKVTFIFEYQLFFLIVVYPFFVKDVCYLACSKKKEHHLLQRETFHVLRNTYFLVPSQES